MNKYRAKRIKAGERSDGLTFDSKAEARRYDDLTLRERIGEIIKGSIRRQVRYQLAVNGVHICAYVADFVYREAHAPECDVVEDVKGVRTKEYKIKRALMKACHGIEITETGAERKKRTRAARTRNKSSTISRAKA